MTQHQGGGYLLLPGRERGGRALLPHAPKTGRVRAPVESIACAGRAKMG